MLKRKSFNFLVPPIDQPNTETFDFEGRASPNTPTNTVQISFRRSVKYDRYYVRLIFLVFMLKKILRNN